ncbi:MAG: hypothetical protein ACFB9N_04430 [Geitlerinemataceae cyanobacterium]
MGELHAATGLTIALAIEKFEPLPLRVSPAVQFRLPILASPFG